ncbi:hypothetical protein J1614_004909 [Plenodomus biglobosus]|nr:hypothetical protein J1614_004909 [Plenodomus biglobosus]
MVYTVNKRGIKNESHHTLSLPLVIPPDAPAALGASGISVLCVPADDRDEVGSLDVLAELPAPVTMEASETDGDADIEARDAEGL